MKSIFGLQDSGRESVIGWNLDLLKKSTFLDTDYLMMTTIEAYSQYRYLQESPKTPTYFWITTKIPGLWILAVKAGN
jgi:hypothetical protein